MGNTSTLQILPLFFTGGGYQQDIDGAVFILIGEYS
jgi:hypothetical protein